VIGMVGESGTGRLVGHGSAGAGGWVGDVGHAGAGGVLRMIRHRG